jgi:RNA polymerase sigma-70 factor (ECF subfamily)
MLGSRADADDVLQDAYLRLEAQADAVEDPERYLFRVVANLCVDRLRAERVRRREYPGPWLPEPLVSHEPPEAAAELAESLTMGFMLLLERLSPAERVVFVLREGFDLDYPEIAALLGIGAAACRQRFARARRHLRDRAGGPLQPATHRDLLTRLATAVAEQQLDVVMSLLADDAVLISDGGGVVAAAVRPVEGAARIAQVLLHIGARRTAAGDFALEFANINGDWGMLLLQDRQVDAAVTLEARDGVIRRIYLVRNPRKLVGLTPDLANL